MIAWPTNLIEDVARRRAILFLGSGVSKNAAGVGGKHPPTWVEFLEAAVQRCENPTRHITKLIKDGDLLTACEILKGKLGYEWSNLLTAEFTAPKYTPSDLHRNLFKLDVRLVLTPNFDKIFDTYAQSESSNTVLLKLYYDEDVAGVLRGEHRAVVKVHGTIDAPPKMIFTREEYARARQQYASFYAILDALALTHTFVFVGCGISDPDMQMFLERYSHAYPAARPHYIIMPRGMHIDVVASIQKNLNLKILPYNPANEHRELADSVAGLVPLVEAKRVELAGTHDW